MIFTVSCLTVLTRVFACMHTQTQGATFSCPCFKLANIYVLHLKSRGRERNMALT